MRALGAGIGLMLIGALVVGCTSDGTPGASGSTSNAVPVGPNSTVPAGAGTQVSSGPGAGSMGPTKNTYTAPISAPYPTPGRSPSKVTDQKSVLDSLPGSKGSSCTVIGKTGQVRAGSVGMGDFLEAQRSYDQQVGKTEVPQLDMFIFPRHVKKLTTATVRIDPPSGKSRTVRTNRTEDADAYQYFAVTLPVRAKGRYKFTVTSGVDRGCFIATFGG